MKKLSHFHLSTLPPTVQKLLQEVKAPPRLVAHLTLVHDVATRIIKELSKLWPHLQYDLEKVLIGSPSKYYFL